MGNDLAQQRRQAHAYLDRLPPEQLNAVHSLLEKMLDPVARAIAHAPIDDEPVSDEEQRTAAESREWLKNNEAIPHEELLAEFGLTSDDFQRLGRTPIPPELNRSDS